MAPALLKNCKIVIGHDVHGDIVCLEFFEDHVLKARHGYKDGSYSLTDIQKDVYWSGPMWVIYNTLKGDLRDMKPNHFVIDGSSMYVGRI